MRVIYAFTTFLLYHHSIVWYYIIYPYISHQKKFKPMKVAVKDAIKSFVTLMTLNIVFLAIWYIQIPPEW